MILPFILYPIILAILAFAIFFILLPLKSLSSYKAKGYLTYFFPVIGGLYPMQTDLRTRGDEFAWYKDFAKNHPNQKLRVTNFGSKPLVTLMDPQYIKELLLKPNLYEKTGITKFISPLVGGEGLVFSEGELWKRHRKIISNSFHYESLKANIGTIRKTTLEFLNKTTKEELQNYSAINKIQEITGEIVGRIFFGENLSNYTLEGKSLTLVLGSLIADLSLVALSPISLIFGDKALHYPVFKSYRDIKRRIDAFRGICFKIIKDRKASGQKGNDLLSSLLVTQNNTDPEQRLSDKEIVDEFITFFVAGMDTTGHLIGMTLYNLTQNPECLEKVCKEIHQIYDKEEVLTADALQSMDELHNVIKETLRIHTPAPFVFLRVALVDHKIGDFEVKKGTLVGPNFIAVTHDERHFPNAEVFDPSRWKENTAGKLDPYAFTPFSAGPRNCIGQHLAIVESKIIVAEFLKKFDFKLKEGYKLKMQMRFLYEPSEELILELKSKS